jgi:RimJ/RimL family protein N-acetyltransferase
LSVCALRPSFETDRLVLRPRALADTDACLEMDGDPAVTQFVGGPWDDPVAHRQFVEARTRGPYPDGLGYWTIRDRQEPGRFLGWVLLIPADGVGPDIEIGWRLRREAWGRGLATEAARPVLAHAFVTLTLARVVAEIDVRNGASIGVAEKLGLRYRGPAGDAQRPALRYTLERGEAVAAAPFIRAAPARPHC